MNFWAVLCLAMIAGCSAGRSDAALQSAQDAAGGDAPSIGMPPEPTPEASGSEPLDASVEASNDAAVISDAPAPPPAAPLRVDGAGSLACKSAFSATFANPPPH